MESALCSTLLLGLSLVPCCHAQGTVGTTNVSNNLPPWLVGLTAVMCFLFVIFVASLVNRVFCSTKKDTEETPTPESDVEVRDVAKTHDNVAMELEEGSFEAAQPKVEEAKQTNM